MTGVPKLLVVAAVLVSSLFLSGCPSSLSSNVYSRDQARTAHYVDMGTVASVRQVLIEGTNSGIGAGTGAALGWHAGHHVGRGHGRHGRHRYHDGIAGSIGGALLGGIVGAAIEESVTRQPGLEITVRMDNGQYTSITQAADVFYQPGDRVRLLTDHYGAARVVY